MWSKVELSVLSRGDGQGRDDDDGGKERRANLSDATTRHHNNNGHVVGCM